MINNNYIGSHRSVLAPFLRMFFTEKIVVAPSVGVSIGKLDPELKGLLMVAKSQMERRGVSTIRMLVQRIQYRKFEIWVFSV